MEIEIKIIDSQKIWDEFVTSCDDYTFLQSWNWGEFQKSRHESVFRLGIYNKEELVGVCLAVTVSAKRGKFMFVPHGPVLRKSGNEDLDILLVQLCFFQLVQYLKKYAKENKCLFLRFSPWLESTDENRKLFKALGFSPAPTLMHTEETWLVDISKTEEQILADMRKTTRNLIRRGEREGVEIHTSDKVSDLHYLYDLQEETSKRHEFVPFSNEYIKSEFEIFIKDNQCLLFLGSFEKQVVSAALIMFYGKTAFYFHSGSKQTTAPVSYLLQWRVIQEAKKRGYTLYNLWGVAPENKPNHPFAGITTFKSGFGGFRKDYMHAQDLILSKKYYLTYLLEKLPRTWRSRLKHV